MPIANVDHFSTNNSSEIFSGSPGTFAPGIGNVLVALNFNQTSGGNLQLDAWYRHSGGSQTSMTSLYDQAHSADIARTLSINALAPYIDPVSASYRHQWTANPNRAWLSIYSFSGTNGDEAVLGDLTIAEFDGDATLSASITVPNGDAVLAWCAGHNFAGFGIAYTGTPGVQLANIPDTSGVVGDSYLIQSDGSQITASWTTADTAYKAFVVLVHLKAPSAGPEPTAPTLGAVQTADDVSARIAVTTPGTGTGTINHELHKSTTQGFTPVWGGPTLDSSYGAAPAEVTATGMTGDTQWYFKLMVKDDVGEATSNEVSVVTAPARPTAVVTSLETENSMRITLSGGSVGTEPQRLWRDDVQIADLEPPRDFFDDAGLAPGTTYDYDARAVGPVYLSGRTSGQGTTLAPETSALLRRRQTMDLRERKYGVATTLLKDVWDLNGQHLVNSPLLSGDVKISQDGGAFVNLTNVPVIVDNMVQISLTAAEMQGAEITIVGQDQDGPLWADFTITISTEGNASAQWSADRDAAAQEASLAPLALEASLAPLDVAVSTRAAEASLAPLTNLDAAVSTRATPADVLAQVDQALLNTLLPDISTPPSGGSVTVAQALSALKILTFHKMTATNDLLTVFAEDGVTPIWTRSLIDDGTTFTPAPAV